MRSAVLLLVLMGCVPWSNADIDGDGVTVAGGDCNDRDSSIHPKAGDNFGNGVDEDCDGVDGNDRDGDGSASVSSGGLDCDDKEETVFPDADELCDGLDNDCDGEEDEDAIDATEWFVDDDEDGFGAIASATRRCGALSGEVEDGTDCDDLAATVYPGALDQCGRDFDCDGSTTPCEHPGADLDSADADWTFIGTQSADWAGQFVSSAGDVNGDQYVDLLIGAPSEVSGGAIYVVHGPLGGGTGSTYDLDQADLILRAEGPAAKAGISVAGVGDIDDDGFDDILIGASLEGGSGAAYLVNGPLGESRDLSTADAEFFGELPGDEVGFKVAAAGDVDGDGFPDLLIAAPFHGMADRGAVYLISAAEAETMTLSAATVKFQGAEEFGHVGWDIAGDADFSGDGIADMLIGAPTTGNGCAYIEHGTGSGTAQVVKSLADADVTMVGEVVGDQAGAAVAFVGDVDGDGRQDAAVAAPSAQRLGSEVGVVYLVLGDPGGPLPGGVAELTGAPAILAGARDGDRIGNTLSAAGDVNDDGFADLLVGCVLCGAGGVAFLVHGPLAGELDVWQTAATSFSGTSEGDLVGAGLAAADVNADGYSDILIGSPEGGRIPEGTGRAFLLVGGM